MSELWGVEKLFEQFYEVCNDIKIVSSSIFIIFVCKDSAEKGALLVEKVDDVQYLPCFCSCFFFCNLYGFSSLFSSSMFELIVCITFTFRLQLWTR